MVAAAICLRVVARELQTLLVRTSSGTRWIFPKGSVKPGETAVTGAVRELFEESGYKAMSFESRPFTEYQLAEYGDPLTACVLVTGARKLHEGERDRHPTWFPYPAARASLQLNRTEAQAAPLLTVLETARTYFLETL